jgi:hypothetical protein
MPLLKKFFIYADYRTFALTSTKKNDFSFPTDVTDQDISRGYRLEKGMLVVYLPDLSSYSLEVEIYAESWSAESGPPSSFFSTTLSVGADSLTVCGLCEEIAEKPTFKMPAGLYKCIARGYFSEERNRFQILLSQFRN